MTYLIFGKSNKVSREKNRGAAMMLAIVIIGIILVFTFSLLLVSYTLYASQNKKVSSVRCSEAANSLSVALEEELDNPDAYKYSALYKYLRCNALQGTRTWPYYDPETPGHGRDEAFRYFDLRTNSNYDKVEGFPGSIKLCIYWTPKDDDAIKDKLLTKSFEELGADRSGAEIHIEIIAESGSQTYTVTNTYEVKMSTIEATSDEGNAIANMSVAKYPDTADDRIYNPMKFGTTDPSNANITPDYTANPIILTEMWSLDFKSRE